MTKRSPETMLAIVETMAGGILSYKAAALANDISQGLFWSWIKASQTTGGREYELEYLGETMLFHKAIAAARRVAMFELRGKFEQKNSMGWDEEVTFQGAPVWRPDPAASAIDDLDLREMLYGRRDGLLVVDGKLVPMTQHHEAPVAGILRNLEVAFREYKPSSSIEVNAAVSLGVTSLPRTPVGATPLAPPPIPLPELEVLDTLAVDEPLIEAAADDPDDDQADSDVVTDTPTPVYADGFVADPAPAPLPAPEVVIREAAPAEYQAPSSPLLAPASDLVRDLMMRARAKGALPPSNDRSKADA